MVQNTLCRTRFNPLCGSGLPHTTQRSGPIYGVGAGGSKP